MLGDAPSLLQPRELPCTRTWSYTCSTRIGVESPQNVAAFSKRSLVPRCTKHCYRCWVSSGMCLAHAHNKGADLAHLMSINVLILHTSSDNACAPLTQLCTCPQWRTGRCWCVMDLTSNLKQVSHQYDGSHCSCTVVYKAKNGSSEEVGYAKSWNRESKYPLWSMKVNR